MIIPAWVGVLQGLGLMGVSWMDTPPRWMRLLVAIWGLVSFLASVMAWVR